MNCVNLYRHPREAERRSNLKRMQMRQIDCRASLAMTIKAIARATENPSVPAGHLPLPVEALGLSPSRILEPLLKGEVARSAGGVGEILAGIIAEDKAMNTIHSGD